MCDHMVMVVGAKLYKKCEYDSKRVAGIVDATVVMNNEYASCFSKQEPVHMEVLEGTPDELEAALIERVRRTVASLQTADQEASQ